MKYLGLDIGSKQVGIAVSDDGGTVAFPLEQVARDVCIERVLVLLDERGIDVVVLGESLDLNGTDNPIMRDVREIAGMLKSRVRTVFEPEQFSTRAAERLGKGSDAEAATIILQSYLDRQRMPEKIVS